ncbi:NYN domain-containing protein [Nannocystaceae bacterium ST9]
MLPLTRLVVFYDGNYFKQGNLYFRYAKDRGWMSFTQLHRLLERYLADRLSGAGEVSPVRIVEAHYYDGRATTRAADDFQLRKDRDFEMSLIDAGIVPHYLPLRETRRRGIGDEPPRYELSQKGIDVELALDVLDLAHHDRFDICVLITGDADFVPLVRKLTALGKQVLLAYFHIDPWVDPRGNQHRPTYASQKLVDVATHQLNFNELVVDEHWREAADALFFVPRGE